MKMFHIIAITLASLSFCSSVCAAEKWSSLIYNEELKTTYLANLDDISYNERGNIETWIAEINIDKSLEHDTLLSLQEFDCKRHRSRYISVSMYLREKHLHTSSRNNDWNYYPKNTIGDTISRCICNGEPVVNTANFHSSSAITLYKQVQPWMRHRIGKTQNPPPKKQQHKNTIPQPSAAEEQFYQYMDKHVPYWNEQNTDEAFLQWLSQKDPTYGFVRQEVLTDAFNRLDAEVVARFFLEFRKVKGRHL